MRPDAAVVATDSFDPGGLILLDAADHRFGFELGPDLTLIRHGPRLDVEFRWFQLHDWIAATPPVDSARGAVLQFATPLGNTLFPAQLSSRYSSSLDSFELNLKRPLTAQMSVLAGFRYLQLREGGLAITQDIGPGATTAVYAMDATNGLCGCQVGAERRLWDRGGPLHLDCLVKGGLYGNGARNRVRVTHETDLLFGSNAATAHAAFVGELGLAAVYEFNERLAARVGYQLEWIEGVALASEQIAVSDPFNGAATVDVTGSPFYHGITAAVEVRW
jgi:hypothetical protein